MAKNNICKNFAIAGAVVCGTAAVAASLWMHVDYVKLLPNTLTIGFLGGLVYGAIDSIGKESEDKMRSLGKGFVFGTLAGATGTYGFAGAIGGIFGLGLGAAIGLPFAYAAERRAENAQRPEPSRANINAFPSPK